MGTQLAADLFTVHDLFDEADVHYEIPIYQRNYSWGAEQIDQLIDDVWAAAQAGAESYFLGNLIVARTRSNPEARYVTYEVVDGQQRLTTLFMLLTLLEDPTKARLTYQSRRTATDALARLKTSEDEEGAGIQSGFKAIETRMGRFGSRDADVQKFRRFLSGQVQLVRAVLPERTDLNKYFEIMNTRGQQLEQVDIVKARLMSYLRSESGGIDADRACFAWIWDACAQMDSYVQMALTPGDTALRADIFGGNWDRMDIDSFDGLLLHLPRRGGPRVAGRTEAVGLRAALSHYAQAAEPPAEEDSENRRFESPIKFPSLLLHALKVLRFSSVEDKDDDGQLDDSKLIKFFDAEFKRLSESERSTRAKRFVEVLLRCKFILDNYVIKREFTATNGEDGAWSLKRLSRGETVSRQGGRERVSARFTNAFARSQDQWDDSPLDDATREVLLLQSMFRVTYTSPRTMHWITRVLREPLLGQPLPQAAEAVRDNLRSYARQKVEQGYFAVPRPTGFTIERIVFTYVDYLLAQGASANFAAVPNFTFVYRNSIEHFFPQYANRDDEGWDLVNPDDPELNMFGNLALVSVSANSKFSNNLPLYKANKAEIVRQSTKLQLMAEIVERRRLWDRAAIREHDEMMVELLRSDLHDGGGGTAAAG